MKEDLFCYVIDSSIVLYKVKQEKMQDIFNKEISPLDIKQEVANEDIFDLIYEIICEFDCNDKFNLEYFSNELQNIICDMESEK